MPSPKILRGRLGKGKSGKSVRIRGGRKLSGKSSKNDETKKRKRKSASSVRLPMEGPKTMEGVKFNTYLRKVLRKVNPGVNLNRNSMKIMDSLVKDTLHSIAEKAACKMGRKKTLKPKVLLKAMKHVMPRNLALHVDKVGQQALERYGRKDRRL